MALILRKFDKTRDAIALLQKDPGARYLGGGTVLVRLANAGEPSITTLVRSTERGLDEIRASGGRTQIGAAVTMARICTHSELGFLAPAARSVGGPAIRSAATVGGNLFMRSPFGDLGVALLALDASVSVQAGYSMRETSLEEFFATRDGALKGAVVSAVSFRAPPPGAFRYLKVSRTHPKGAAVVTLAAVLTESSGRITGARVAYGAMAVTPMRAKAVELALSGKPRTREGIAPALAAALSGTAPRSDAIASEWYRREVLPVHLGRLLLN